MNNSTRPRRLRNTAPLRSMVRETRMSAKSLIYPLFLVEQENTKQEISSMPGQYRYSPDRVGEVIEEYLDAGITSFLLFGIPSEKDEVGSGAYAEDGIVQQGIRLIKERYPEAFLIGDVCLCEYTSHGHCGKLDGEWLNNDESLLLLQKTALSQVQAGIDMVAPSAMADFQIAAIRESLDEAGFTDAPIMSYSAKYSSAFYGPFRDAADSAPSFGDRKSYQMDPHNSREAIKESIIDEAEGADILMVKPAMAYLDIISKVKEATDLPLAAYSVSGEYSMIKAAGAAGLLDEYATLCEVATGIYRAGADILITYAAKELAGAIMKGDIG